MKLLQLLLFVIAFLRSNADSKRSADLFSAIWNTLMDWPENPQAQAGTPSCSYDSTVNSILCLYLEAPNMELLVQALQETSQFITSFGVNIQSSNGSAIPLGVFEGYNIVSLSLSGNNFKAIPYSLLSSIGSPLDYLYLAYDSLPSLASTTLFLPYSVFLTELYIEQSNVSAVDLATFAQYANLKILSLSDNSFTKIGLEYIGLETLEELDLQNCVIASIETGAFRDLGSLKKLYLNNNDISTIQEGAFLGIETSPIAEIYLSDNPFNCTCELQWLKDWLDVRNLTAASGANCADPVFAPFGDVVFC